jgi:hypothetical protein
MGVVCLGTTAQMIDFRIADLRALAFHRIAFLKYSFLEASNSLMISRARAWACTCKGTLSGSRTDSLAMHYWVFLCLPMWLINMVGKMWELADQAATSAQQG